jgi:hypothetical protein
MEVGKCAYRVWWGKLMGRDYLEDLGMDERMVLNGS